MKNRWMALVAVFAVAGLLYAADARAQWGGGGEDDAHGGSPAAAGGEAMGGMGGMGGGMGDIASALGLDDQQWKKFNALRRKYRRATIEMQAKIDVAEVDLEELVDSPDMDMKKIESKIKDIAGMRADLRVYRYKTLAELKTFISAEQFDTFRWMAMKSGFHFGGGEGGEEGGHGHMMGH
jgi:Spy/CpxP family protein refolding chaperone